jgi:hypothetical protein
MFMIDFSRSLRRDLAQVNNHLNMQEGTLRVMTEVLRDVREGQKRLGAEDASEDMGDELWAEDLEPEVLGEDAKREGEGDYGVADAREISEESAKESTGEETEVDETMRD